MHDQIGLLHHQLTEQNNENRLHNHNIKLNEMKDQGIKFFIIIINVIINIIIIDMTEVYALKEQLQNERGTYIYIDIDQIHQYY